MEPRRPSGVPGAVASTDAVDLRESRRGPLLVALLLLVPALGIGLNQLRKGGKELVWVVGAGPIAALRAEDAPEGFRYQLEAVPQEPVRDTQLRIEERLRLHPTTIVLGLSDGAPELGLALERLLRDAQEAAIGAVVLGPTGGAVDTSAQRRFRDACRRARRVVCVDPAATPDEVDLRAAVAQAVVEVGAQVRALRATTQGPR